MNKRHILWAIVIVALLAIAYYAMRPRPTENVSRETLPDSPSDTDDTTRTQRVIAGIGSGLTGIASIVAGAA